MSHQEVETFFSDYVQWMRRDIGREIEWFESTGKDVGNILCALGLVVYTEALGRIRRWNMKRIEFLTFDYREKPQENFEVMFDRLGHATYGMWRREFDATHFDTSLYEVLRSGMVHEYRPKVPAFFHMGGADLPRGVVYERLQLGFYVMPYYRDFCVAADELLVELRALPDPSLADPHMRHGVNAIYNGPVVGALPASLGRVVSPTSNAAPTGAVASTADPRNVPPEWLSSRSCAPRCAQRSDGHRSRTRRSSRCRRRRAVGSTSCSHRSSPCWARPRRAGISAGHACRSIAPSQ
jgi:hypothetical protein